MIETETKGMTTKSQTHFFAIQLQNIQIHNKRSDEKSGLTPPSVRTVICLAGGVQIAMSVCLSVCLSAGRTGSNR
jgi:hypothetical protein